ncbi:Ig-like domain-containing domain [Algoriphagus litoralis]|uniref:Ig-like domain-containing domain n=1 Tax=Algoriphagus litoralis TaxID=2202829 RepID=UPI000DB9A03D|nr:Ig-like domain-containing domain [Algoriphagus litoralis]
MGGPRDEDPPKLVEANPLNQSLNIKPEIITLTFDEYIKLENASKGIIITPRLNKDEIVFTALKNQVSIKLNQELEDSTTYVFNFQKSVVDISEENPAENLKLVFSTGNSIDSLSVTGSISYLFPPSKPDFSNVIVGIYPVNDTTDVFTASPYYLSQTDSTGKFSITNIKAGDYLAYAWKDSNGTLKAEFKSEEYDFLLDTLTINKNLENIQFNLSKADLTPIRIMRTGQYGNNFDVVLNRMPIETTIKNEELGKEYFYTLSDNRIRIYPKNPTNDSIPFNITLQDSVGFQKDSLIWAKFPESERKPDKLQVTANSGKSFYNTLEIELKFTKPIQSINFDSLYITYDTASIIPIVPSMLQFADSVKRDLLKVTLSIPDTVSRDVFTIKASDSTFLDIENQVNETLLSANYRKLKRENLADEISGRILDAKPPFIVQLLNSKNELIREEFLENTDAYSFKLLEPGTFKIRVIEDLNGNKRWDPSNFLQKRNAERVFYFINEENTQELIIRSGWTRPEQDIKANTPTGTIKSTNTAVENEN